MKSFKSTIWADGRTTVPAAVRGALRLRPGDKLLWALTREGTVLVRVQRVRRRRQAHAGSL